MFVWDDVTIDTRSLAVLRIGFGVLLCVDILLRGRNFTYYYTEHGVVPYSIVSELFTPYNDVYSPTSTLPIFELTTSSLFIGGVFIAAFITGLLLIVGYKTTLATVLAFVFVSMIDARNPFVLSYADTVFHLLLFWSIFLPLGERWSIDATQRFRETKENTTSVWSALILLQILTMYLGNAYHKLQPDWSVDSALFPVMTAIDRVTYTQIKYVNEYELLLQPVSHTWTGLMLISPLLLFLNGKSRAVLTIPFLLAHLMMAATFRIGAFPYIVIIALFLFIQTPVWDAISIKANKHSQLLRLYDTITRISTTVGRKLTSIEPRKETQHKWKKQVQTLCVVILIISTTLLIVVTIGNAAGTINSEHGGTETILETIDVAGLHQPAWDFYASDPPYHDRYLVLVAKTNDGEYVNIETNEHVENTSESIANQRPYENEELHKKNDNSYRDRFYYSSIISSNSTNIDDIREEYVKYHSESWSTTSNTNAETVMMYVVTEEITAENRLNREKRNTTVNKLHQHQLNTENESQT